MTSMETRTPAPARDVERAQTPLHAAELTPTTSQTPPTSQAKLSIEHLNFYYGSAHALHDITVALPANKITAFIGPSGCGKSTFLRTLNRMYETIKGTRLDGSITLDSEDIFELDVTTLRRRIGMVF